MKLPIVYEIEDALETVTAIEVDRSERNLDPLDPTADTQLGTIDDFDLRRLLALGFRYSGQARKLTTEATFDADDQIRILELNREASRLEVIASLCRDIFWVEVRSHVGGDAWGASNIGIRKGDPFPILTKSKPKSSGNFAEMLFKMPGRPED